MTYASFLHKTKLAIAALLISAGALYANADTTNTESSDSSEPKENNETLPVEVSTEVAEVDSTVANFNEEEEKLAQKEETEGDPIFETESFKITNGKLIVRRENTEYKERIEWAQNYPYFGNMLTDMAKAIMINEQDDGNADYFIKKLINVANGILMRQQELDSPAGKEFMDKYSTQYNELIKYRNIIRTITENFNNGEIVLDNTATQGVAFFLKKISENPKYQLTETEKFQVSNGLFYTILDLTGKKHWKDKDFADYKVLMDEEEGIEIPKDNIMAYLVVLAGGDYGKTRQEVFAHTMDINSDPSFVPASAYANTSIDDL